MILDVFSNLNDSMILMLRIPHSYQNSFYADIAVPLALVNTEGAEFFNFAGVFHKGTGLSTLLCLLRRQVSPSTLSSVSVLQRKGDCKDKTLTRFLKWPPKLAS